MKKLFRIDISAGMYIPFTKQHCWIDIELDIELLEYSTDLVSRYIEEGIGTFANTLLFIENTNLPNPFSIWILNQLNLLEKTLHMIAVPETSSELQTMGLVIHKEYNLTIDIIDEEYHELTELIIGIEDANLTNEILFKRLGYDTNFPLTKDQRWLIVKEKIPFKEWRKRYLNEK